MKETEERAVDPKHRRLIQQVAVEEIQQFANKMGLQGVGGAMVVEDGETVWNPTIVVVGKFQRSPDPKRGVGDNGSNYAAVGFSKLAEMMDTGVDSGSIVNTRKPKKGEFGYAGGRIVRVGSVRVAAFF